MVEQTKQTGSELMLAAKVSAIAPRYRKVLLSAFAILGCISLCFIAVRVYRVSSTESKLKQLDAEYAWTHDVISARSDERPSEAAQLLAKFLGNTVVSDISSVQVGKKHPVSESQLEVLSKMPRLQAIEINCNAATDKTLALLGALPDLRYLSLAGNRFSVMGLLELRHATKLRRLEIDTSILTPIELAVLRSELHDVQLQDLDAPAPQRGLQSICEAA
ncbi:MAG: hypothetical protein AAGG44_21570 [Planctomycetota bacterium]